MGRPSEAIRQLAHPLHAREAMGQKGVLDRMFRVLQVNDTIHIQVDHVSLDSTAVTVHPDGTGAQKNGPQSLGKSRAGWTSKIHLAAADAKAAVTFSLVR